ncbi:preprotein translocase subunit SecA [Oxytricha trifallax]|uniref:Preprotein translocase subunit SecA n=1 Tax=Oxytricha trifallax TaxID=1172189 RepID=A0A073I0C2_9SPIT|nr:preprotein translocase subunit SecA [Oxytricha trifallax]
MPDWIKFFKICSQLIGLSVSALSQKEETCLQITFKQKEIKFPLLSMLKSDRKSQLQKLLYNGSQQEYCKSIYELCMKQTLSTPVIIVSSGTYSIIEQYFKKFNELQFYSMKGVKGSKVDAYLEGKFKIQNSNKRYSVLLLTEIQGRGTDLPATKEIEDNGGLYLIISDVFSKRQTEQIIGRVGRLENKGQYRHMILISGSQDTVEQAIQFRQDFLENESHIKFSKLQTILSQQYEPIKQKENEISAVTTSMNENQNLDQEEREISAFEDIEIVESYNQAQQNKITSPITQSHGQNDLKQKKGVEYVLQIENNQSTDADVGCLKQVAEQKKQAQSKKVQKRENIMEIDQQAKTQSSISSNLNQKRVQKSIMKSNEKKIKTLKQTQSHKEAQGGEVSCTGL